jgi:hypothetical protein
MKMREDEFLNILKERYHYNFITGHDALDFARHVLKTIRDHAAEYNSDVTELDNVIYYLDTYKFRYET